MEIDEFHMSDSLPMAKKRFETLQRKLLNDPGLAINLNQQMQLYLEKEYAR